MGSTFRIRAKFLARVVAPLLFATALNACSTVPDWVDPTTWVGDDSQASGDQTSDAVGADQSTAAGTDQSAPAGQEAASAQSSDGVHTPDIAAIPPKPTPPSTADEQKQVADSLAADRAQAHYSADALRGGTEAAAAPPSAESAAPQASGSSSSSAAAGTNRTADADASSSANNQTAANPPAPPADATAPSGGGGEEKAANAQPAAAAPATESTSSAGPAPNQIASADTAAAAAPAAAPIAAEPAQVAPGVQATFAPSKAPALDPSVNQFVPRQILSRYQETAAAASVPAESSSAATTKHHHRKKVKTSQRVIRLHYASRLSGKHTAMIHGGFSRELANTMLRGRLLKQPVPLHGGLDPGLFATASEAALAIVDFTRETTILDTTARSRIQSAARNFTAKGGTGFVRVVGHASDPGSDLPHAIRLRNNFERSEAQATAVARELIRDGVPPQKVLVEADGDRSRDGGHLMARASRNAEIFLQS
ncbi:MAG TPA: OmpA family protein [Rhizomicrobium sp.]|jgi:hypothetical protein|nr:OmpA family protein [Rhizomicrobium sp.]